MSDGCASQCVQLAEDEERGKSVSWARYRSRRCGLNSWIAQSLSQGYDACGLVDGRRYSGTICAGFSVWVIGNAWVVRNDRWS